MKTQLNPNQLLNQLQQMADMAQSGKMGNAAIQPNTGIKPSGDVQSVGQTSPAEFQNLLTKAIDTVNQYQSEAGLAARQIESGDGGVSLVKAMIASQKSNVAFQAAVQVRNKVVTAYQDIMNMPI
jgi:flagellar hook-basal body complex protein FliE